ncbi:MAG: hypothetical protein DMG96_17905 [Acidobacteria bacterium]|nr:MAG: hypothetical protein DMG96_17905 [Acidobacteriota bacterium]
MRLRAVCGLGRADLRAELIARLRSIIRGRTPRAKGNRRQSFYIPRGQYRGFSCSRPAASEGAKL